MIKDKYIIKLRREIEYKEFKIEVFGSSIEEYFRLFDEVCNGKHSGNIFYYSPNILNDQKYLNKIKNLGFRIF